MRMMMWCWSGRCRVGALFQGTTKLWGQWWERRWMGQKQRRAVNQ